MVNLDSVADRSHPQGVQRGGSGAGPYLLSQFFRKMDTFQTIVLPVTNSQFRVGGRRRAATPRAADRPAWE